MTAQPSTIGRYEIKSRIGRGGMGDLYLASDPNTNRLVAIKLLSATLDSSELRERFAREARALAALNHPNIVGIYDTGEYEDSPFIVMEYVRGETLSELIKRRASLSVSQKLRLMEELCAGLSQAHEAGIIHRDVKPSNLMVDQQNHLKILDFGIARIAEGGRTRVGVPLTQANMQIGTPGYMSPEQIEGGAVDHRSDIFAVGAVCYELLAYDEAFSGANTGQIESRVMRGTPRPLATLVPGLDQEIDEIILRALKTDPNKRYQDATTFRRALERYRLRLEPEVADAAPRPTPPPSGPRGNTREARAEAAYQRALASYQRGSRDAARRFATEALAEDTSHAGAGALLSRLEKRPAETPIGPPRPNPQPGRSAISDNAPTMVSTRAGGFPIASGSRPVSGAPLTSGSMAGPDSTILSGSTTGARDPLASGDTRASGDTFASDDTRTLDRTRASGPPASGSDRRQASASAPTVVVPVPKGSSGSPLARMPSWLGGKGRGSNARRQESSRRDAGPQQAQQPIWIRYGKTAPIVVVALLLLLIGGGAVLLISWLAPSGELLTVTKPTGGTLSGPGIRCGTLGGDCSVRRPKGETVELTEQNDPQFEFGGWTGDCAPGGLMILNRAKICSAVFNRVTEPPAEAKQTLTISPMPIGGTIEGLDILCGTKGAACSAQYPAGVVAGLHATADDPYTFMGYTGDCSPIGQTQMTAPRTCGGTFSPKELLKPGKPDFKPEPRPTPSPRPKPGPDSGGDQSKPSSSSSSSPSPQPPPQAQPPPAAPPSSQPPQQQEKPGEVPTPISDVDYAKNAVKTALKDLCDAYEALNPDAVLQVYPKMDPTVLRNQLNKRMWKSVKCTFAEPKFDALDPAAGTAKVKVDRKLIFERTSLGDKPEVGEYIATITFSRASQRGKWLIETAKYDPKPKEK